MIGSILTALFLFRVSFTSFTGICTDIGRSGEGMWSPPKKRKDKKEEPIRIIIRWKNNNNYLTSAKILPPTIIGGA